jgi:hypothetical protein
VEEAARLNQALADALASAEKTRRDAEEEAARLNQAWTDALADAEKARRDAKEGAARLKEALANAHPLVEMAHDAQGGAARLKRALVDAAAAIPQSAAVRLFSCATDEGDAAQVKFGTIYDNVEGVPPHDLAQVAQLSRLAVDDGVADVPNPTLAPMLMPTQTPGVDCKENLWYDFLRPDPRVVGL